ncbi:Glucose-methanol-choline oxidoreductase, N-terminal,Glucose-methanol-choline oxidoreductase, C- [Cinara cedri]|uniref:Glucose-methanol-choline oxidoreductase, N-terminal,Glucose-methanol-choline oxidoreductase, C n=1 Tax=Cinara cedri TaxID=506608 RepID=A0A5E4MQ79_9HEMI|nr:Glucose-methanol-choline oxidoreductase, N-terminal,Glucose-methanol-choline oxidoreductase, C- [Cinara cedri]
MAVFRILLLLMGLLAVFLGNGVSSSLLNASAFAKKSDSSLIKAVKTTSESEATAVAKSSSSNSSSKLSNSISRSVSSSTSRSVTVEKKSTTFKKKCWSELIKDNAVRINTLEMCPKYGYDVEGLYVVPEFLKLLNSLNREQCSMFSRITYPRDYSLSIKNDDEFDVIIVGCGASGSVLASKLSDEKDLNVLILEAGNTPSIESEIPGLWATSIGSEMDWNYRAETDTTFGQSLTDQRVALIRGKCLGGTTALNTMLYDRGVDADYTKFELAGLTKWCWKDVIKYYKRSEDCKFEKITTNETVRKSHNQGGKLNVDSFHNTKTVEIRQVYSTALNAANYSTVDFFDVKNHQGFISSVAIVKNGLRVNAAKAFLKNANRKYNLKISARSTVKRVLFEDKKAVGVEFENSVGELIKVKSKQSVILSAGPIGSPQLLLSSGVGPLKDLLSLDIPVVAENDNVGLNLQAHPNFLGLVVKFESQPIKSYSISEMVFEYLIKHTGPLATIGLGSFTGFIDIDGNGTPDIQIFFYYYSEDDTVFMPSQLDAFNYNDNITEQLIDLNDHNDIQIVGISLLRPKNTGQVTIQKNGEEWEPTIKYGSLDDEDVDTLMKAIQWVKDLIQSEAFKHYGPTIVPLKIEGGPEPDANSAEYWKHVIKHLTTMNIQIAGTCSMATTSDKGVVSEDLEVFDTEGLMVVDSSVLPIMFSAESCAPSMMVAEKASDLILKKLGLRNESDDDEIPDLRK